ncbi:hypothetical protein AN958_06683 [Leucoagaricus sp. SymC.cos]|nr:hypothetical protein AN958_06683 [Leucoagaricus sp. SymC.cos]
MSAEDIITAYSVAVPEKQKKALPGLDKCIEREWFSAQKCVCHTRALRLRIGVEYAKLEVWDDEGKPGLREYQGSDKFQNKASVTTGGDSGINRAVAIMFACEGCLGITVSHLPKEREAAQEAKKQVEESGTKVSLVSCDLMEDDSCRELVESHKQRFRICKNFEEIDLGKVESTSRSNILQMIVISKFAVPRLKRGSSIIDTASITAYRESGGLLDYSSTEGAIVSFTRSLAVQLTPKGIHVDAVAPGPVITALQASSRTAEGMKGFGVGMLLHVRAGQPAELEPAYVFLASSDSNIMTGQVTHINSELFRLIKATGTYGRTSGEHVGGS